MGKAETLRRLIVGDLRRIFRHRYGAVLPDDDAGRDDLMLLLLPISLSRKAEVEKMQHEIEVSAPWMGSTEAGQLIDQIMRLPTYFRRPSRKEIGERIRLTNAERERLKAWRIAPVDMTAADLAEQRKTKERDRKARKRRQAGAISRPAYVAKSLTKQKPWEAEGISRATWYRRRETSASATILSIGPEQPVSLPPRLNRPRAFKGNLSPPHSQNGMGQRSGKAQESVATKHAGTTCLTQPKG
jgi:hypothetical protein